MKRFVLLLLTISSVYFSSCESMLETGLDYQMKKVNKNFVYETTHVITLDISLANYEGITGKNVNFSIYKGNEEIAAGQTDNNGNYSTKLVLPTYVESLNIRTDHPEYQGDVTVDIDLNAIHIDLYNDLDNSLTMEQPVNMEKIASPGNSVASSTTIEGYEFVFGGVTDNGDGTYTWTYSITGDGSARHALSHWVLGLCDDHSVSNVLPNNNWEVGDDPRTGLYGLKWDHSVEKSGETKTFSFTLNENYEVGSVDVAMKAGPNSFHSTIDGPSCTVNSGIDDPYDEANGDLKVYIENVEGRSCIEVFYNGNKIEEISTSKLITLYVNSTDSVRVVTHDNPDFTGNYCGWFVQYGTSSFTVEEHNYEIDLTAPLISTHNFVKVTPWIAAGDCQCDDDDSDDDDSDDDVADYTVCDGYPDWDEKYASVRFKSFGNSGSNEHYLGVNDLGDGGNRSETNYTWGIPGSYDVKFEYDASTHTLSSIIDNDNATKLEYVIGVAPDNSINVMEIDVVQRTAGATVEFNDVELNGNSVGDFAGDGWKSWTISDFDVTGGFELTGTLVLSGDFSESSSELDKIQISLGHDDNPCNADGDDDDDNDGVGNGDDDHPNDPDKAFNNITDGVLAYEDLWPVKGDYDFNDLVVDYTINQITNADNKITQIKINLKVIAAGAKYNNAFGLEIDGLTPAGVSGVEGDFMHETNITSTRESVNGNFVLMPFDHTMQLFDAATIYINTRQYPPNDARELSYTINLSTPVSITEFDEPPYNPFIVINSILNGDEVHLMGKPSTFMETSQDNPYQDENGMPWAIHIAEAFDYPIEDIDIRIVYLHFVEWTESGGELYKDWYKDLDGYRNPTHTYTQQD